MISVYQKNHLIIEVIVEDEQTEEALNLADCQVYFVVKNRGRKVISKSTEDGTITVTDTAGGKIEIELTAEDTDLVAGELYNGEILVIDANNQRYTANQPRLTVLKSHSKGVG